MSDILTNFIASDEEDKVLPPVYRTRTPVSSPTSAAPSRAVSTPSAVAPPAGSAGKIPESFLKKDDSLHVVFRPSKKDPEEEVEIPRFKKEITTLMNRSTILYGGSGAGKSTLTLDFMYIMRFVFPFIFVFAPTNSENHTYDDIVPAPLLYENFGLHHIKDIYNRQRAAASIYNMANNPKVLHTLFMRVASEKAKMFLRKLLALKQKAVNDAIKKSVSVSDKQRKVKEIESIFKDKLVRFYKQVISPHAERLQTMRDLKEEEKYSLRFRNFNPRVLVIFDDAMTEVMKLIREGKKMEDEVIKNFFFKGRHAYITHMYCFQDDVKLDSDIRKNAFYSIFCSKQVAACFFERTANGFSAREKKMAQAVIEEIFSADNEDKYYKLVYARLEKKKFQYVMGEEHDPFQMCATIVRKYLDKVITKGSTFDTSNPFFSKFAANI